jgi:aspartate 1-decarboxylase
MEYGVITQTYMNSGKLDSKGREIGFIVAFRDNGTDFRAYVQNARREFGVWKDFGAQQRSKSFADQPSATLWAYATARQRIAKLHKEKIIALTEKEYANIERAMQWPEDLAAYDRLNAPIKATLEGWII